MTREGVAIMVASIGLPYAYYQFPEGTGQKPPFVVFFFSASDDLYADDSNYQRIEQLNIELYTKDKDFAKEETLEGVLKTNGFSVKPSSTSAISIVDFSPLRSNVLCPCQYTIDMIL